MKLLFDQNLSFKLSRLLDDLFPGSTQARLAGLAEATDMAIWEYAKDGGFILVSLDSDFVDIASLLGPPPKLIWLRRGNRPTAEVEKVLRSHVDALGAFATDERAILEIY